MPTQTAADSFLALIPPRSAAEIQRDIVSAEQDRVAADAAQRNAVSLRAGTEARIQAKKNEIETAKDRKNIAKREKRDARRGLARSRAEGAGAGEGPARAAEVAPRDGNRSREEAGRAGRPPTGRRSSWRVSSRSSAPSARGCAPGGAEAVRLDQVDARRSSRPRWKPRSSGRSASATSRTGRSRSSSGGSRSSRRGASSSAEVEPAHAASETHPRRQPAVLHPAGLDLRPVPRSGAGAGRDRGGLSLPPGRVPRVLHGAAALPGRHPPSHADADPGSRPAGAAIRRADGRAGPRARAAHRGRHHPRGRGGLRPGLQPLLLLRSPADTTASRASCT